LILSEKSAQLGGCAIGKVEWAVEGRSMLTTWYNRTIQGGLLVVHRLHHREVENRAL